MLRAQGDEVDDELQQRVGDLRAVAPGAAPQRPQQHRHGAQLPQHRRRGLDNLKSTFSQTDRQRTIGKRPSYTRPQLNQLLRMHAFGMPGVENLIHKKC